MKSCSLGIQTWFRLIPPLKEKAKIPEYDDEEDANSLVIKMLGNHLAKPKTNAECQAINRPIDLKKLK